MPKSLHTNILLLLLECFTIVPAPLFPNVSQVTIPCFKEFPMVSLFYPALVLGPSVRSIILVTDDSMDEKADSPGTWHPTTDETQWDLLESAMLRVAPQLRGLCIQMPDMNAGSQPLERPHLDRIAHHLSALLTNIDLSAVIVLPTTIMALASLPALSVLAIALAEKNSKLHQNLAPLYRMPLYNQRFLFHNFLAAFLATHSA